MDSFNAKRKKLIKVICLMMDESMIGWGPKTSKRGGLPKITFEPRKPVPLGTMLRNSLDCVTGILVHQDIAMAAEVQTEDDSSRRETTSSTSPSSKTLGWQNSLALGKVWLTKDVWFRNVTTLLGQCTVDMHRCFRNRMIEKGVAPSKVDSIRILKFTDMMCGGLKQWPKPKQHFLIVGNEDGKGDGRLTRIYGKDGEEPSHPLNNRSSKEGTLAMHMCGTVSYAEDTSPKRGSKSTIRHPSGVANATCPCAELIDPKTKNSVHREVDILLASMRTIMQATIVLFVAVKCMVRRSSSQRRSSYRYIQDAAAETPALLDGLVCFNFGIFQTF
ncbi:hypothetical protein IV203_017399 [Nitzschia inconspicua]|uniref:Uncharacterized protein n=1 Tax=Nitzschia inconspicua TaxID=303405 RepID=A0A9K3K5N2_9STRA|nr:hypothetical protein IV203_017584 [Nitzschia inconspicua]KAG7343327.1 hypothetical protein IV203_021272 [Nitzschia inconspicua]KAG7348694.1 hypothetical protein IV203_017399 [Nitzschia inconspicua]